MIYQNYWKKATTAIRKLVTEETKMPVYYDKEYTFRRNTFFNVKPIDVTTLENMGSARLRQYLMEMRYYYRREGYRKHTVLDPIHEMAERVQRLFYNNPQPENEEVEFSTYYTPFSHSVDYWNLISKYQYHNGFVDEVVYDPARTPSEDVPALHIVEFIIRVNVLEPITTRS